MRIKLKSWRCCACLAFIGIASPLHAQEEPATPSQANSGCEVLAITMPGAPQMLQARCGGEVLLLGPADEYTVATNAELDATVVDMGSGTGRRILLLRLREDGGPIVEDMTTTIALAAGKGRVSPIDDVTVDLDAFAAEGELGVSAGAAEEAVRGRTIDVGEMVILEQVSEAASTSE